MRYSKLNDGLGESRILGSRELVGSQTGAHEVRNTKIFLSSDGYKSLFVPRILQIQRNYNPRVTL